jgi:predicted RNase H-like nuclease (RuvC/YqgF family)
VDDLASRAVERIGDLAEAIREARAESTKDYESFGPMIRDHSDMRADMRHLTSDVAKIAAAVDHLEDRFEEEKRERLEGQRARKEEFDAAVAEREMQHRDLRVKYMQMMVGIGGIFLTSLGGIVVAYLAQRGGK